MKTKATNDNDDNNDCNVLNKNVNLSRATASFGGEYGSCSFSNTITNKDSQRSQSSESTTGSTNSGNSSSRSSIIQHGVRNALVIDFPPATNTSNTNTTSNSRYNKYPFDRSDYNNESQQNENIEENINTSNYCIKKIKLKRTIIADLFFIVIVIFCYCVIEGVRKLNNKHSYDDSYHNNYIVINASSSETEDVEDTTTTKQKNNENNTTTFKNDDNDILKFDYIIVGGGPSGIITATKLAKGLLQEHHDNEKLSTNESEQPPQVLLIESGTSSQSSVLQSLKRHNDEIDKNYNSDSNHLYGIHKQPQQQEGFLWSDNDNENNNFVLNKFDIPLMWTGVSSSQQRRKYLFTTYENNRHYWSNHHWPIQNMLLARGLGGCGIHNAMIYIRSLPTDFDSWNLTGWTFDDILPHYVSMETYDDTNRNNRHWPKPSFWSSPSPNISCEEQQQPNRQHENAEKRNAPISPCSSLPSWRGTNGPVTTCPAGPEIDYIAPLFVKSALNTGDVQLAYEGFNHPNPKRRLGVGYYEFNIKNGIRDSIAKSFLGEDNNDDAKLPNNLHIWTDKTVKRVVFESELSPTTKSTTTATMKPTTAITNKGQPQKSTGTKSMDGTTKSQASPRAIAVEYIDNRSKKIEQVMLKQQQKFMVEEEKGEVILTAGAIMTPQILFNSGIGENGKILHLPGVGKNLHDHPVIPIAFSTSASASNSGFHNQGQHIFDMGDEMENYSLIAEELQSIVMKLNEKERKNNHSEESQSSEPIEYKHEEEKDVLCERYQILKSQLGPFGTTGFSSGAFLKSPYATGKGVDANDPDIQLTVFPRIIEPHVTVNTDTHRTSNHGSSDTDSSPFLVTVALLRPDARYEVQDAYAHDNNNHTLVMQPEQGNPFNEEMDYKLPSIRIPKDSSGRQKHQYLSELDVKRLSWGIQQVRNIVSREPLLNITNKELYPGQEYTDDKKLEHYIHQNHLPNCHWVGTTKMGLDNDPMAVLDENLRVRGILGLRVFDAGAIPRVPNGNTHSTVCVVASRGVDLILKSRRRMRSKPNRSLLQQQQ